MNYVAWRMLVGDTTKYLSLVVGLTFSVLLIAQQGSIFTGLMSRTYGTITDVNAARIWVMDPGVQYPDDLKPLKDPDLLRVRDVPGVEWAVPFFKATARARMTASGEFQTSMILGIDRASLIGAPAEMLEGKITDLWKADGVIIDDAGAQRLGGVKVGSILELNDHRAKVVGICRVQRSFNSFPILYTTYDRAKLYVPRERHVMTFVLASPKPGVSDEELADRITRTTKLKALTSWGFALSTLTYYTKHTGITINFGITVLLGFLVGLAIAGQTFYTFTIENLKHFGALKAMGATNGTLVKMILLQGIATGAIGYGLGVGGAAGFGRLIGAHGQLAFKMPPELLGAAFVLMLFLVCFASVISIRKVVRLEPAIVFRG